MGRPNSAAAADGNRCFVVVDATISRAVAAAERQTLDDVVATSFIRLSSDWNADPNAPDERVAVNGCTVTLEFNLAGFLHEPQRGRLVFERSWRYRLGDTNDEGWFLGQCRFSRIAPAWGEFYEVGGDLLDTSVTDWVVLPPVCRAVTKHFLFYLRDTTFECDAAGFRLLEPDVV